MARTRSRGAVSDAAGIVRDLVHQFDDPLHFLRELVQNSIDAGSNRIDVVLEFPDGEVVLLTRLCEGQRARVLQLPAASRPVNAAHEQRRDLIVN